MEGADPFFDYLVELDEISPLNESEAMVNIDYPSYPPQQYGEEINQYEASQNQLTSDMKNLGISHSQHSPSDSSSPSTTSSHSTPVIPTEVYLPFLQDAKPELIREKVNQAIGQAKQLDSATRRRIQNKLAQQKLRERKKAEKRELERKAENYNQKEAELEAWVKEAADLRAIIRSQKAEIEDLHMRIATIEQQKNAAVAAAAAASANAAAAAATESTSTSVPMELATPVLPQRGTSSAKKGSSASGALVAPAMSVLDYRPSMSRSEVEKCANNVSKALRSGNTNKVSELVHTARQAGFWSAGSPVRPEVNPVHVDDEMFMIPWKAPDPSGRRNSAPALMLGNDIHTTLPAGSEWLGKWKELELTQGQVDNMVRYRNEFITELRRTFFERASLNKQVLMLLKGNKVSSVPQGVPPVAKMEDISVIESKVQNFDIKDLPVLLQRLYMNLQTEIHLRTDFENKFFTTLSVEQIAKLMVMSSQYPRPSPILVANTMRMARSIL